MCQGKSGRAAYNIYLGKDNVGSGNRYFVNRDALLPRNESVFFPFVYHFPRVWEKKFLTRFLFHFYLFYWILSLLSQLLPSKHLRRLQDVFAIRLRKMSSRRLQDVFETFSWCLQGFFKTSSRHLGRQINVTLKTSYEFLLGKLRRAVLVTAFASILFDQKAIFHGAGEYDSIIHGVIPIPHVNDIASLCENSYQFWKS